MSNGYSGDLQETIRQRRLIRGLTLGKLGAMSGVSPSHLGRIERGERFPSARILRKIAKPLGIDEAELFTFAGYLSQRSVETDNPGSGRLEPYVATVLSQEPVETQRAVVTILILLKSMATYGKRSD